MGVLAIARYVILVVIIVIDARTRTLPNWLALVFLIVCLACGIAWDGFFVLSNLIKAVVVCGLLLALEMFWRSRHDGASGLGMGDIRFLFCLMLSDPELGLLAFVVGLLLLALAGTLLKKKSLPLLPFAAGSYLALSLLTYL